MGGKVSNLDLRTASGSKPPIHLGEVDVGLSDGDTNPLLLVLTNRDNFSLSEIRVRTEGPAAHAVQLARDEDGKPGVWEPVIFARVGVLSSNNSCEFWVRARPSSGLKLGQQEFTFVVNSVAVIVE